MQKEGFTSVQVDYKKSDWQMDPKGYFLIDIDRKENKILVAHFFNDKTKNILIEGSDPIAIYYTIIKKGLISLMPHAAYLGQEIEKAYIALKFNLKYVQDDTLTLKEVDECTPKGSSDKDHQSLNQSQKDSPSAKSGFCKHDEFLKKKQKEYGNDDGAQYH